MLDEDGQCHRLLVVGRNDVVGTVGLLVTVAVLEVDGIDLAIVCLQPVVKLVLLRGRNAVENACRIKLFIITATEAEQAGQQQQ